MTIKKAVRYLLAAFLILSFNFLIPRIMPGDPLFNLLGTREPDKKHILFPGGHGIPWEYRQQYHAEIVGWLDKYLGPAKTQLIKDD